MQQYSIFFNHIPYSNQTLNEYKKTHPKRIYRSYTNPCKTDLDLNIYSGSYYCVNHLLQFCRLQQFRLVGLSFSLQRLMKLVFQV